MGKHNRYSMYGCASVSQLQSCFFVEVIARGNLARNRPKPCGRQFAATATGTSAARYHAGTAAGAGPGANGHRLTAGLTANRVSSDTQPTVALQQM